MDNQFTEYKDSHKQKCCESLLTTLEDHFGGGSHYWTLKCETCGKRYVYDTYRFQLEEYPLTK